MRKLFLAGITASLLLSACNNTSEKAKTTDSITDSVESSTPVSSTIDTSANTFNLNDIPLSTAELGEFPYFNTPDGAQFINNPKVKAYDIMYVALPDGSLVKKEGKVYRAFIHPVSSTSSEEISNAGINQFFEKQINKAGGVLIHEGRWTPAQLKIYDEMASYKGADGSIDVYNNQVKTYVIHRVDGNIYVQMESGTGNTSAFQIIKEEVK